MACKTCDHTMQRVNNGEPPVFWCPRCGTLKTKDMVHGAPETIEEPMLVDRATKLCMAVDADLLIDNGVLTGAVAESVGLHL